MRHDALVGPERHRVRHRTVSYITESVGELGQACDVDHRSWGFACWRRGIARRPIRERPETSCPAFSYGVRCNPVRFDALGRVRGSVQASNEIIGSNFMRCTASRAMLTAGL